MLGPDVGGRAEGGTREMRQKSDIGELTRMTAPQEMSTSAPSFLVRHYMMNDRFQKHK